MSSTVARPQMPFAHQCMPGITLRMAALCGAAQRHIVHSANPGLRQSPLQHVVAWHRQLYHVWREEGRDDRHRHNDGVEKLSYHAERQT